MGFERQLAKHLDSIGILNLFWLEGNRPHTVAVKFAAEKLAVREHQWREEADAGVGKQGELTAFEVEAPDIAHASVVRTAHEAASVRSKTELAEIAVL